MFPTSVDAQSGLLLCFSYATIRFSRNWPISGRIYWCSKGSILQYFRPSLRYHLSLRYLFCLLLSGHLRQVLLYVITTSLIINLSWAPLPGRVAQSVRCLATDASLTADPGVAISIPARTNTFMEIDHEIISTFILLPSAYKRKYVQEVLVNPLFKLAQKNVWLGELTVPPRPKLLTWDVKQQNKQTLHSLHLRRAINLKK